VRASKDEIRLAAEADLAVFIQLVHPLRVLGSIHHEIIEWMEREERSRHQIILMPRDHMKSALVGGYRTAWYIVKNPAIRILYISSTANLAIKQLKFIKDILTSDAVRRYWPELVNKEEANREKWTENEISVDHPLRKLENVRDPTVFTAGLTTTVTGLHCDVQVLDDVVIKENAYTEDGRQRVAEQYSLLASVASGGECEQWVVGTRYHPKDLYNDLLSMTVEQFNDEGEIIGHKQLYEVFRDGNTAVENRGDGTGEFLWPRQQRKDGKWFGFDRSILAEKRSMYLDKVQYRAQYYNDPNDPGSGGISKDCFQYYERNFLTRRDGFWFYKGRRLNVFASIDFAYSMSAKADYSSIVVVGVDPDQQYYVLDIERFKTTLVSDYFSYILRLHQKWDFRQLTAEVTAAQMTIVTTLKNQYIAKHGLALSVKDFRPNRMQGSKQERVSAILQPRYDARQIWHYQGGHCQTLEEELILQNPPHDDIKDCLATCIDSCIAPAFRRTSVEGVTQTAFHSRFGGVV
jgi:hypothetical protein